MSREQLIDLDKKQLGLLNKILKRQIPNKTVWAYGSRVTWKANEISDLDLTVFECNSTQISSLREEFEESDLLISVDVMDWESIPDKFKENIKKKYVVLQAKRELEGWREVKLGDVVKSNCQNIGKDYEYSQILYLDTGSITAGRIKNLDDYQVLQAPSRAKRLVKNGDIVYSNVRPIQRHYGFIKNPPDNLIVSTGFSVIETDRSKAEPLFIYHLLASNNIVKKLDSIAEGATSAYPSLRPSDIEDLEVLLPPLPEQKAIAEILSSLDDKIDLLHRQNKTLEDIAQTLFRQWFIEDADEDWKEVILGDFFPVITGKKDANYSTSNGRYPFFTCAQGVLQAPDYSFEGKAILLTGNGDFNVKRYEGKFEAYQRTYVLIPHEDTYFGFLYTLIKYFLAEITSGSQGSVIRFITKGMITDFTFLIPKTNFDDSLEQINEIYSKVDFNQSQIHTLENLRDTLLSKLMSGKVRISSKSNQWDA